MNENFGSNNFLLTDVTHFNGMFPHFQTDQQKNLYVFIPTVSPMQYDLSQNTGSVENSSSDEEIFPDFRCKSCSIAIPTYREYKAHLDSHDESGNEISVLEQSVEIVMEDAPSLKPQTSNDETSDHGDSSDPKPFKSFAALKEHFRQHPHLKEIFCVMCKSPFSCISSLRKHILMFHCKNRDRKSCPYCSYRCFQTSDLEKHIARRHTRDFKYKCTSCVKGFATPKELRNHERRKHSDAVEVIVKPESK